jgi:hypothetical protein
LGGDRRTKKKNIFVITTNKRPVPLEHYLWVSNERYKIVDNRSNFLMGGYQSAMQAAKQKQVCLFYLLVYIYIFLFRFRFRRFRFRVIFILRPNPTDQVRGCDGQGRTSQRRQAATHEMGEDDRPTAREGAPARRRLRLLQEEVRGTAPPTSATPDC